MDDKLIGTLLGMYEIKARLGKGGMGMVYRGRHVSLDREVAIKVLLPELSSDLEFVERFLREAKAVARLNHPNIIQIYDANVHENIYYFVMECVEGRDLGGILKGKGLFDESEALQLIRQAATGLAYAHGRGIIHRDVKPENFMLNTEGTLKIGDLGLAKWRQNDASQGLTTTGVVMGTPWYISPEQIRDSREIDARADIYSLGMTLFHMLAGKPAFSKGSGAEIMAQHLSDKPPPLKDLNPKVSDATISLIQRMIVKERDERTASMEDVVREISLILEKQPSTIVSAHAKRTPPILNRSWKSKFRKVAITIGLVFVFLVILGGLAKHKREKEKAREDALSEEKSHDPSEDWFSAAENGTMATLQSLAKKGADIHSVNDHGETALLLAAKNGQAAAVQFLLEKGADVNKTDTHKATPLMHAANANHGDVIRLLLNKQATVDLFSAAVISDVATVNNLLAAKAEINSPFVDGKTALMAAAEHGQPEMVKLLLARGADAKIKTSDDKTALSLAEENNQSEIADLLRKSGAKE